MATEHRDSHDSRNPFARLFSPGPLAWILGLLPPKHRFHTGPHLHGLEEHDIAARDVTWFPDPTGRRIDRLQ